MNTRLTLMVLACAVLTGVPPRSLAAGEPVDDQAWRMHTVDGSSRGADGVRLGDLNRDGLPDIVTGWEEGNLVRVYLNPGPDKSKSNWPAVTVGAAPHVEDAVFVDLDGDGMLDVVSSCEGNTKKHFVHWAPRSVNDLLDEKKWTTEPIPATDEVSRWMFCLPLNVDDQRGIDLVVGSKNPDGQIGWLQSPENPRDLAAWRYHRWQTAGWIMSIRAVDMELDGDPDVLVSDRKGESKGVFWLENPDDGRPNWTRREIGGSENESMFLDVHRDSESKKISIACATRNQNVFVYSRADSIDQTTPSPVDSAWAVATIPNPFKVGNGKAAAMGDVNLDGKLDIVHTTNTQRMKPPVPGVAVLVAGNGSDWSALPISTSRGIKYDRIELIDLDNDGDLDVLTCEERSNLGVIWFENPTR